MLACHLHGLVLVFGWLWFRGFKLVPVARRDNPTFDGLSPDARSSLDESSSWLSAPPAFIIPRVIDAFGGERSEDISTQSAALAVLGGFAGHSGPGGMPNRTIDDADAES
jgi:hypothetical protein